MNQPELLSRRTVITRAALNAVAGAGIASTQAAADVPPATGAIQASEYWVSKGEVRLYLYRKRIVSSNRVSAPRPVLFLAHGSSVSSVPSFDLEVPGRGEFSMMNAFARYGFDVWTMDFEGYGRSSRTGGNSGIARGALNIGMAVPLIQRETGQDQFHYYGGSAGALRVGVYAQEHPEQVARMGLSSLSYTGEGSTTLAKRKEALPFLTTHDRRPRDREMIESIFTRDKTGTYDPAAPEAIAQMELKLPGSDTVPTGSYVDMTTKLPLLDPAKAVRPLLIIRGEFDGIATEDDVLNFFRHAATADREFRLIPGATHALEWGNQRALAWEALRSFLAATPRP